MKNLIEFTLCGWASGECNPYELTSTAECQRLLLLINRKPADALFISKELDLPVERIVELLSRLERCGLVKEEGGLYRPSFAIFTREDWELLAPIVDRLALSVAEIIRSSADAVRGVLEALTIVRRGLWFPELDYIVVGALALDYEALDVLAEEGLMVKAKRMSGGEYVFTGFEAGIVNLKAGWMWDHTSKFGRYFFSTHGRLPPAGPRLALPDIAWLWNWQGVSLDAIISKMVELGDILANLVDGDLKFEELKKVVAVDAITLASDLSLLHALGYVRLIGWDLWRLGVPMFKREEYEKLRSSARSISRLVAGKLREHLSEVERYYGMTAPARNGIPLEEALNPLYHFVFEKGSGHSDKWQHHW